MQCSLWWPSKLSLLVCLLSIVETLLNLTLHKAKLFQTIGTNILLAIFFKMAKSMCVCVFLILW